MDELVRELLARQKRQLPQPDPLRPLDAEHPYPLTQFGTRPDGTAKGNGFFGALMRPDGRGVSSEISVGVNVDGQETDIPSLVPTLTAEELELLLSQDGVGRMPDSIVDKAVAFARQRRATGKPVFAQPGEEDLTRYPHLRRAGQRPDGIK